MNNKKEKQGSGKKVSLDRGVFQRNRRGRDTESLDTKREQEVAAAVQHHEITEQDAEIVLKFAKENQKKGMRIFVAGGSRKGNSDIYVQEAYKLGRKIAELGFRLDFGLSSYGIMGAVARGVLDVYSEKGLIANGEDSPINAITTDLYLAYYENDAILTQIGNLVVARSLEERKKMLLESDFIVFAPGGIGTLDELVYDCVAMQDGMLPSKPFIIFNVQGYFYHLMEYLKEISFKEFSDKMPFIVVDNCEEAEIVFELLKDGKLKGLKMNDLYDRVREIIYTLPYILSLRKKEKRSLDVKEIVDMIKKTANKGSKKEREQQRIDMEQAYLQKEIERMNARLTKAARDVAFQGSKLEKLFSRMHSNHKRKEETDLLL